MFSHSQRRLILMWIEKISNPLAINLHVRYFNTIQRVGVGHSVKEVPTDVGNYSFFIFRSHHCVGLSSSCLSICKDAYVVPFKTMLQHLLSNVSIDELLSSKMGIIRIR